MFFGDLAQRNEFTDRAGVTWVLAACGHFARASAPGEHIDCCRTCLALLEMGVRVPVVFPWRAAPGLGLVVGSRLPDDRGIAG